MSRTRAGVPAADGFDLWVQVVPGASTDEIVGRHGDALRVRVTAPPERGRANRAVEALLAARLGIAPSDVQVVRGGTSKRKLVRIRGVDASAATALVGGGRAD